MKRKPPVPAGPAPRTHSRSAGAAALLAAASVLAIAAPVEEARLASDEPAARDSFGDAVALSDDTALVGASYDGRAGVRSGAVHVFTRAGAAWTRQARLAPSDSAAGDEFGVAVAISGDWAVVGAPGDDHAGADVGAAYVLRRVAGVWAVAQRLEGDALSRGFGRTVAIGGGAIDGGAIDGDRIAVGSWNDRSAPGSIFDGPGSVHVFAYDGLAWNLEQRIQPADRTSKILFGSSVSLAGDTALIGASFDNTTFVNAGSAYVYRRSGTTWSFEQKLTASDGQNFDGFGFRASLSGDTAMILQYGSYGAKAYVFTRAGAIWTEQQQLTTADTGDPLSNVVGRTVCVRGDAALIGEAGWGRANVFRFTGTRWAHDVELVASEVSAFGSFETPVSLSGDRALIGVPSGGPPSAAFVFRLTGGGGGGVNVAPAFVLPPISSANPAQAGSPVKFATLATDANKGDKIAYEWHFGDGTTADTKTKPAAAKTFATPGTYEVFVRATDGKGGSADSERTSVVVVAPGTPYFDVAKVSVGLRFTKTGKDTIKVSGQFPLADGTPVAGKALEFEFGDVTHAFVLDANGQSGKGAVSAKVRPPKGGVAKFTVTLTGSFADVLAALGLTNETIKKVDATTRVAITFDGTPFVEQYVLVYTGKSGKSGAAK